MAWAEDLSAQPFGWLGQTIQERGLWLGLIAVFIGGLALNLTPCVYPLIPVTLAFFSRQTSGRTLPTARLALCYVLGISMSYAALGLAAAKTGALLGAWLQQPVVLIATSAMIVVLALSMFGWFELTVPQALTRPLGRVSDGPGGALLMGLGIGVIAAPCIGPFVLGLFLFISQRADVWTGFAIFFTLGLGMGLPYLLLASVVGRLTRLPKAGAWLVWSKHALGVVLLGLALYYLRPLLPVAAVSWMFAGLLLGAGAYLGWLAHVEQATRRFVWLRRVLGAALAAAALTVVWPASNANAPRVAWQPYTEAALEQAQREQRPIIVDIYADWCLPCVEMDHVTFRHPGVVQALASVATLRVDATSELSPDAERLIGRYRIYGAPTMLFFNRSGTERRDLRLLGFAPPAEFLELLKKLLNDLLPSGRDAGDR